MDVKAALYHTVHDYGVEELATFLGKSKSTLYQEVNPQPDGAAKAGLLDVLKMIDRAQDFRVVHAINARFNFCAVPMPRLPQGEHEDTMAQVARMAREFGEVMTDIAKSLEDGRVSQNELKQVERQWGDLQAAGMVVIATLAAKAKAAQPAGALRAPARVSKRRVR